MAERLLEVRDLRVEYPPFGPEAAVVRGVNLDIDTSEAVALVGESGSGKTTVALAILNYLGTGGRLTAGTIRFAGTDLVRLGARDRRRLYGRQIAHVAQDPANALNPALRIGLQLTEGMILHLGMTQAQARTRALALLEEVHLSDGEALLEAYPHHLSGGMQQRVCIAQALACDPQLVILDEPTTGLDAATETAILNLLKDLKARRKLAVLLISHNLAAVSGLADRVAVMYGGRNVESGPARAVFSRPAHRYTAMLLEALPSAIHPRRDLSEIPWQGSKIPQSGCPFRDRCDIAIPACEAEPQQVAVAEGRLSACVRWQALLDGGDALGSSRPALERATRADRPDDAAAEAILGVRDLVHSYGRRLIGRRKRADRRAVDRVSFRLRRGEVLALIGESGSGKSTLARCLVGLLHPDEGAIEFAGIDLAQRRRYPLSVSRQLQIVFQNIAGSLHPRKTMHRVLSRPYLLYEGRTPDSGELRTLVESVGLKAELLDKRTPALSGGERQRTALARAFAMKPRVVILDEAFSALDASMKVKVARLLLAKKDELGASYLFITHDLPFVHYMADRIMVMYRGWICQVGPRASVLEPPFHPYTETLVWSALSLEGVNPAQLDLARAASAGRDATAQNMGCRFQDRCPRKLGSICEHEAPPVQTIATDHWIACHRPVDELRELQRCEWQGVLDHQGDGQNATA